MYRAAPLMPLLLLVAAGCAPQEDAEPLPGASSPPPGFVIVAPTWAVPGANLHVEARGGPTTGTAALLASVVSGGVVDCPPVLIGHCLDLFTPIRVLQVGQLAAGKVAFDVAVPASITLSQAWIEVATPAGGAKSTASALLTFLDPAGDEDGDGLLNFDEAAIWGTSPVEDDSDADGLDDGDEVRRYGTDPASEDSDGDSLEDGFEATIIRTDPRDADTDDDGLDDGQEVHGTLTDPDDADSDDDWLGDGEEVTTFGTDPEEWDSDGGGRSDGGEVAGGGDPLDPTDDGSAVGPRVLITEVCDHPGDPGARYVELYNSGDEPQMLAGWSVRRYSDGSTTSTNILLSTSASLPPRGHWVIAADAAAFTAAFGRAPSQTSGEVTGDGDDVYALSNGTLNTDLLGVIGQSPAPGTSWSYADAVARRRDAVVSPTVTFAGPAEWTVSAGAATAGPFVR